MTNAELLATLPYGTLVRRRQWDDDMYTEMVTTNGQTILVGHDGIPDLRCQGALCDNDTEFDANGDRGIVIVGSTVTGLLAEFERLGIKTLSDLVTRLEGKQ